MKCHKCFQDDVSRIKSLVNASTFEWKDISDLPLDNSLPKLITSDILVRVERGAYKYRAPNKYKLNSIFFT